MTDDPLGPLQLGGKLSPYEEDVRLPLYVRGPGVPKNVQLPHLVANTDFTPTFLDLAGERGRGQVGRKAAGSGQETGSNGGLRNGQQGMDSGLPGDL